MVGTIGDGDLADRENLAIRAARASATRSVAQAARWPPFDAQPVGPRRNHTPAAVAGMPPAFTHAVMQRFHRRNCSSRASILDDRHVARGMAAGPGGLVL